MACKPHSQVIPGSAVRVGGLQAAGASLGQCIERGSCAVRFDSRPGTSELIGHLVTPPRVWTNGEKFATVFYRKQFFYIYLYR